MRIPSSVRAAWWAAFALASTIVGVGSAAAQGGPSDDVYGSTGIQHEQTVTGVSAGSSTVSTSSIVQAATGDLYLAAVSSKIFEPVTDVSGLGLGWQLVAVQCAGREQTGLSLWWAQGSPSGNGVVSATLSSAPGQAAIAVTRYSGVDPDDAIAATVSVNANGIDGGCSGGVDESDWAVALTTSGSAVAYGAVAHRYGGHSPGFGYTERAEVLAGIGGDAASVSVVDGEVPTEGVVTVDGLFDDGVDWAAIVVEVVPARNVYMLDVVSVGPGCVVLDPPGRSFRADTGVELIAVPQPGSRLQGWSGALAGAANPETVIVSSNLAVTATFEEIPDRTITVTTSGLGDVLLGPAGGTYHEDTDVVLFADPVSGWRFDGWEGAATGQDNPTTLRVLADHAVTARFEEIPHRSLGVTIAGTGVVTLSPPGGDYEEGTVVTLDPEPSPGWRFDRWFDAVVGSQSPASLVMDDDHAVFAIFVPAAAGEGHVLAMNTAGLGRIEVDPPGVYFAPGAPVVLTATPEPGWTWSGWSGAISGSTNPYPLAMDGHKSVTGTFVLSSDAELTAHTIGAGNVVLDPARGAYPLGSQVSITAEPLRGWTFERWEGDASGVANPMTYIVGASRDFVAVFRYDGLPTPGLWTSASELFEAPTHGAAWNAVYTAANGNFYPPIISRDSDDNVRCLAAAVIHARTGDPGYRQRVVDACLWLVDQGVPPGETLAWAREIGAYAMAADLVGHRTPQLEAWFRNVAEVWEASDQRTLVAMHHTRPNNWGTMAFATLCAVYAYLDDFEALAALRSRWIRGVRGPNPGYDYGDLSWQADPYDPRQINPAGATKGGVIIDGALPDDARRGGSFRNPPTRTQYPWGALQGLTVAARILERYDPRLGIWHVEDKAIHRAARLLQITWDDEYGGWSAEGDDAWMLQFLDEAYGTSWSTADPDEWGAGKNSGWAYVLSTNPVATGGTITPGSGAFLLKQNFPNPFGPSTRIRYQLPRAERVQLTIYDVMGRAVTTLLDGVQPPGPHTLLWNGVDSGGRPVASGVYWCRVQAGTRSGTIKLTLIR